MSSSHDYLNEFQCDIKQSLGLADKKDTSDSGEELHRVALRVSQYQTCHGEGYLG